MSCPHEPAACRARALRQILGACRLCGGPVAHARILQCAHVLSGMSGRARRGRKGSGQDLQLVRDRRLGFVLAALLPHVYPASRDRRCPRTRSASAGLQPRHWAVCHLRHRPPRALGALLRHQPVQRRPGRACPEGLGDSTCLGRPHALVLDAFRVAELTARTCSMRRVFVFLGSLDW